MNCAQCDDPGGFLGSHDCRAYCPPCLRRVAADSSDPECLWCGGKGWAVTNLFESEITLDSHIERCDSCDALNGDAAAKVIAYHILADI